MKDESDIYNSKLFFEVEKIKQSIKTEIREKSWNTSVSPTIYNSRKVEIFSSASGGRAHKNKI